MMGLKRPQEVLQLPERVLQSPHTRRLPLHPQMHADALPFRPDRPRQLVWTAPAMSSQRPRPTDVRDAPTGRVPPAWDIEACHSDSCSAWRNNDEISIMTSWRVITAGYSQYRTHIDRIHVNTGPSTCTVEYGG